MFPEDVTAKTIDDLLLGSKGQMLAPHSLIRRAAEWPKLVPVDECARMFGASPA